MSSGNKWWYVQLNSNLFIEPMGQLTLFPNTDLITEVWQTVKYSHKWKILLLEPEVVDIPCFSYCQYTNKWLKQSVHLWDFRLNYYVCLTNSRLLKYMLTENRTKSNLDHSHSQSTRTQSGHFIGPLSLHQYTVHVQEGNRVIDQRIFNGALLGAVICCWCWAYFGWATTPWTETTDKQFSREKISIFRQLHRSIQFIMSFAGLTYLHIYQGLVLV